MNANAAFEDIPLFEVIQALNGHKNAITSVSFHPGGNLIATSSRDGSIIIWSLKSGVPTHTIRGHKNSVGVVSFSPAGDLLASGSRDGTVKLWDFRNGQQMGVFSTSTESFNALSFDASGRFIAAGGRGPIIIFLDVRERKQLYALRGHGRNVNGIAFHPTKSMMASCGHDKIVTVWDPWRGEIIYSLRGHRDQVLSAAFSRDGNILATCSIDGLIKIWTMGDGNLARTLEGHFDAVEHIAFSANGKLLASKGHDGAVRLWDIATWQTIGVIRYDVDSSQLLSPLDFHPQSDFLAMPSASPEDKNGKGYESISIWKLNLDYLAIAQNEFTSYTSAKIVLVGESNVGKSYLAHRIATGDSPKPGTVGSTHGMKFWPIIPTSEVNAPPRGEARSEKKYANLLFSEHINSRRDIILWDMGGQEEYRLIHQLFLHDTTVALILLDPTRGHAAFREVEAWNKALEKQLAGRSVVKILVGAKLDTPSEMVDRQGLTHLITECGFQGYYETSAINGRGVDELCRAVAKAITWDRLSQTNRPALFQAIRDEIEKRKAVGTVVILFDDLDRELQETGRLASFLPKLQDAATASDVDAGTKALDAVCCQLAQQGLIARAKNSAGSNALILRIEEVERYAGSLILASKANQADRGVPAIELRTIGQEKFHFPGIEDRKRLPRQEERSVVECTVQLMLQHGICFQHEGLLIFPSLFSSPTPTSDENLLHSISLYYDFAGAIDNIYASLVAWLVLAKEFGKVRLSADRAEFEVLDGGLCGLRKVARPGGFAHVDVYFDEKTPTLKRNEFVSFVEDHLASNGIEVKERIAVPCPQGFIFDEETIRMRIAEGDKDVLCPRCKTSHSLAEGIAQARERDSTISLHTWALRTEIERRREQVSDQAIQALGKREKEINSNSPLRLLHLSDLHFSSSTPVAARLQWLLDDLKLRSGLNISELDYLVISGDFTDKGTPAGLEKAHEFVSALTEEFDLSAGRCLFVPGNHDIRNIREAYDWQESPDGLAAGEWIKQGDVVLARNMEKYHLRFKPFSDTFYHKFLQCPYPSNFADQGIAAPFWEDGVQFLLLNSCWQIDQFNPKRSGVHVDAVANVIRQAQRQETEARKLGHLTKDRQLLKIAVWHHAVAGPEQMKDTDFVGNLWKNGVKLALHGDVHEMQRDQIGYRHRRDIHIIGSGSFGARSIALPESTPRLYNVLEIHRDLKSVRVHTRCQPRPEGPWQGWYEWEDLKNGAGRIAYYDIKL